MNYLDILALVIIAVSALTAFFKGLTVELFWLAGVVAGYFLATNFYQEAAYLLLQAGLGPIAAGFVGFVSLFLLGLIAGSVAGHLLTRVWKILRLRWLDRLFGAVFGLLRGLLVAMVLFLAFTLFPVPGEDALSTSRLAPYFLTIAQGAVKAAPQDFEDLFETGYDRLYRVWIERDAARED